MATQVSFTHLSLHVYRSDSVVRLSLRTVMSTNIGSKKNPSHKRSPTLKAGPDLLSMVRFLKGKLKEAPY